MDVTKYSDY